LSVATRNIDSKSSWCTALYLKYDPKACFSLTPEIGLRSDKNQFKAFTGAAEGGTIFVTPLQQISKQGFHFLSLTQTLRKIIV